MQIRNVPIGYQDPQALIKQPPILDTLGGRAGPSPASIVSGAIKPNAAMVEILSRYDVTDISPEEFSEMIQKLYDADAITEKELQQLTVVRHDLATAGVDADESTNLLEFYAQKIKQASRDLADSDDPTSRRQQLAPMLRQLQWLEKFALIQSDPAAIGLDAVA